jgi:hypothetical protein
MHVIEVVAAAIAFRPTLGTRGPPIVLVTRGQGMFPFRWRV